MNALDRSFFAIMGRIDQDLEVTNCRISCHRRKIEECMKDIDLLHAPTVDVLSQLEYLEEINRERETRINQLEEVDAKRERRMQELEEVLVTIKPCQC